MNACKCTFLHESCAFLSIAKKIELLSLLYIFLIIIFVCALSPYVMMETIY